MEAPSSKAAVLLCQASFVLVLVCQAWSHSTNFSQKRLTHGKFSGGRGHSILPLLIFQMFQTGWALVATLMRARYVTVSSQKRTTILQDRGNKLELSSSSVSPSETGFFLFSFYFSGAAFIF